MTFIDILNGAKPYKENVIITTYERGQIIGVPYRQADGEQLGYIIKIDEHTQETVYNDEIESMIVGELLIQRRTA